MKTAKYVLYIFLFALIASSCKNENDMPVFPTKYVRILEQNIRVKTEEENKITIHAHFDSEETSKEKFTWSISDPDLATIITNDDNSVTIIGLTPGQTTLKVESENGKLKYFSTLNIQQGFSFKYPIFIDFGTILSGEPFNNFVHPNDKILDQLKDEQGNNMDYSIEIDGTFATLDRYHPNLLGLPLEVSNDLFFNDGFGVANPVPSASFIVSQLNKKLKYKFIFYGSIDDLNITETEYRVVGENEGVSYLYTSKNESNTTTVENIIPDENGRIRITLQPGPNNTQWAKFYCINAMVIAPEDYILPLP